MTHFKQKPSIDVLEDKESSFQRSASFEHFEVATIAGSDLKREYEQELLEKLKQERSHRTFFSRNIFSMTCWYLGTVLFIVFLSGSSFYNIDNSVLIALLTTTTANVIGLFLTVTKYFFNKNS